MRQIARSRCPQKPACSVSSNENKRPLSASGNNKTVATSAVTKPTTPIEPGKVRNQLRRYATVPIDEETEVLREVGKGWKIEHIFAHRDNDPYQVSNQRQRQNEDANT